MKISEWFGKVVTTFPHMNSFDWLWCMGMSDKEMERILAGEEPKIHSVWNFLTILDQETYPEGVDLIRLFDEQVSPTYSERWDCTWKVALTRYRLRDLELALGSLTRGEVENTISEMIGTLTRKYLQGLKNV